MKALLIRMAILLLILSGCTPQTKLFYWGQYSSTLYKYKKNPDDNSLAAHKQSLHDVITRSPKLHKKIPPGICAEYGYILYREGRTNEGIEYLEKETVLYPESKSFVQKLKDELMRGTP